MSEAPEMCAASGCCADCGPRLPACPRHWALVPTHEQIGYHEALEASLAAPDVQAARRVARSRIALVLRGGLV